MADVCGESSSGAGTTTQLPTEGAPAQQPAGPQQPVYCQVLGCGVLLTGGKTYCVKKRACTAHIQAEAVMLSEDDSTAYRFCQQCGKFETLNKFDGSKRSCRARLAKRRSGTRAQLLKKGCGCKGSSTDQGASSCLTSHSQDAAAAAAQHEQQHVFTAEQQLRMMYGDSGEQLFNLLSEPSLDPATAAAAVAAAEAGQAGSSPHHAGPALSDGAAIAAATAAAAAAAATNAAAAAAHHALSAPLFTFGAGAGVAEQRPRSAAGTAPGLDVSNLTEDQMGQAEVLLALQAAEDGSEPVLRLHTSTSSGNAAASAAGVDAKPVQGPHVTFAEPTSCSIPLSKLDLGHSGSFAKLPHMSPDSPLASMGPAPCKSAPLTGLQSTPSNLFQAIGLPPQRSHSTATAAAYQQQQQQQQQQKSMTRDGSRLKWLIQELQQELDVCNPAELDTLNNEELGTLLCAALAPSNASTATAHGLGSGSLAALQPDATTSPLMGAFGPAQPAPSASFGVGGPGLGSAPVTSDLDLSFHQAQVQQLQLKVQQLQLELQMRRDAQPDNSHAGAAAAAADRGISAAAVLNATPAYRSTSVVESSSGVQQQLPVLQRAYGGSGNLTAPLPSVHAVGAASGPLGLGAPNRPHTPGHTASPLGLARGWSNTSSSSATAMQLLLLQQQQQQQVLPPQVSQQVVAQAPLHMNMSAPMSADVAAMQFMSLQAQLRIAEEEMVDLLKRQAAAAAAAAR